MLAGVTIKQYYAYMLRRQQRVESKPELPPSRLVDTSTRVLFPRFQYEFPLDASVYQRDLKFIAEPYDWLDDAEVALLKNPTSVKERVTDQNYKGKWWGVYHRVDRISTRPRLFVDPTNGGREILYGSTLLKHSYLWDQQAMSGSAHEVILTRMRTDFTQYKNVLSLLFTRGANGASDEQRLAIAQFGDFESIQWSEPAKPASEKVDFQLAVLRSLATQQVVEKI